MPPIQLGSWLLSAGPYSTTLGPDRERCASFDLEGRPLSWLLRDVLYRRSLSSEVHARSGRGIGRRRRRLAMDEAASAFATLGEMVAAAPRRGLPPELRARLQRIASWSPARLLAEAERFQRAYHPVSILPPDQYRAVVLQATVGCTWNRCSFCSFYMDRAFRRRSREEFAAHVEAVAALLGRAAPLRDRIFLGDGDALALPMGRLRGVLAQAREAFPGRPVAGFVEAHQGRRRSPDEWAELRELGLRRVCLGLESGHDPLLRLLEKPGLAADGAAALAALKRAGLAVAAVLLCGAGGRRFAAAHRRDTVALLRGSPLGEGDIVYLSPFVEHAASEYGARARAEGILPHGPEEVEAAMAALRRDLRAALPAVKVARYDIRDFLY